MLKLLFLFNLLISITFSNTLILKNDKNYNGSIDVGVYRKETEVVTSSTNTFSISYLSGLGDEDTLQLLNDIYRQS